MHKLILLVIPVTLVAAIAVGCGGGKKTITVGNTKVQVGGSLPSNFPKDFPVYKGASFTGSYSSTQQGITGTAATWQTDDGVDKVKSFYDQQLKDGPWKANSNGSSGDTAFWIADSPDGKQEAYVGATNSSGKTTIIVTVGDKSQSSSSSSQDNTPASSSSSSDQTSTSSSSSDNSTPPPATVPAETTLPSDFPNDRVPFPSGARVTSATSLSSNGVKTFIVELYVQDSPSNVNDYFKNELPKHDWTDSFTSESNGQFFLTFGGAATASGSNEGVTVDVAQSDTPGYTKVSLSVQVKG